MILKAEHLTKSFGGLVAVNDLSLSVRPGELSAIIGPNGAGKSTLFDLLSARTRPDSGTVMFEGRNISRLKPHHICHLGIGRSFQKQNIFPRLTALENIQIAVLSKQKRTRNIFLPVRGLAEEESMAILEQIGLLEKRDDLAGLLAHGDQKRLEIGIALAGRPRLLLLDEPTAGMGPEETQAMMRLVEKLARDQNLTLLFVEHDMHVVFSIAEIVRVMHLGSIIAEGGPEEIRANENVQKIYLGEAA